MALFKSKAARKMERDIEIRKGLNLIRRNIKNLEKNELGYVEKARQAQAMGSQQQYQFLKKILAKTLYQKQLLERQLLALETALQIKEQVEAHAQFAQAMNQMAKSINLAFQNTQLNESQKNFQQAVSNAKSIEDKMDMLLDVNQELLGNEFLEADHSFSEEIWQEAENKIAQTNSEELDQKIAEEIKELEKEMGRE